MQNKGAIKLFTILVALVCLYQLSFTFRAKQVENDARDYANGDVTKERFYLDSISGQPVYNLGFKNFTYKEVKEQEINLGLDLKGGMNVTLEVSVPEIVKSLSNNSSNKDFIAAMDKAVADQKDSQDDFVTLFGRAFNEVAPGKKLAPIFSTMELRDKVKFNDTNEQVIKVIDEETDNAISNSFNILRSRIDRFGVAQPNIQQLQTKGRILVELPGIKDPERVRKLLQGTAKLEFWETYANAEVAPILGQLNQRLYEYNEANAPKEEKEAKAEEKKETKEGDLVEALKNDSTQTDMEDMAKRAPLFRILNPMISQTGQAYPGPIVGMAHVRDTAQINKILAMPSIKSMIPTTMRLAWGAQPTEKGGSIYQMYALKVTNRDGSAALSGDVVIDARQEFGQNKATSEVSMAMNAEGAKAWSRLTRENINNSIAIVLDGYVQSAPNVQNAIEGGRSQITGNFSIEEAKDLANMLKSGKLPAPAHIVQEEMVGPTLGQESIQAGFYSFVIAFILILVYMIFFYSTGAGVVADIALITNLFFVVGILACFKAVLTLPGIAGIVLTIGMSVDANVLIYERIQEELRSGKGLRLAVTDGYKSALSAIIDGQITTLLTGIVLFYFGSGPIKGFATTLIIGIITSMWCGIFITRLIIERRLDKGKNITFVTSMTATWLTNVNIKFIEKRKVAYMVSGVLILASIVSLMTKGLNYSIDFQGGRTYVVRFDQPVKVEGVAKSLAKEFDGAPEVKTFGDDNQVRITTDYRIDEDGITVDEQIESKLYEGCKGFFAKAPTKDHFLKVDRVSSQKVGPTISDDIKKDALISIFFSLIIIFLYILIRFSEWQYGLGAVAALAHDSLIVLGFFSIFDGLLPFSLDIDQAFIAAILTVVGYSINDTVVVFDRLREYIGLHPKRNREEIIDSALSSTLRRTFSTSLSTFVVLLAIFLFGGTSIKGFTLALLIGVVVGTYSSIFIATPVAYDTRKKAMSSKK
ncbi:protein translocase subunit SecDF [Halosquirtibacter xylanolyticus]|uniref:protein translocase subunit SecDF n=1 Tax=Halosquirtibacter xylanolyticus TaxID=3374599 RepID=UPI0037478BBE|nr:protein translocase subunit SecDF [Prolixibacteraceae bacterium]